MHCETDNLYFLLFLSKIFEIFDANKMNLINYLIFMYIYEFF